MNSRYTCPLCSTPHQLTHYIDIETGNYLADQVGICNRRTKCGYHYPPKQYFKEHSISKNDLYVDNQNNSIIKTKESCSIISNTYPKQNSIPDYIDHAIFAASQKDSEYDQNNLIIYLDTIFGKEIVNHLINIYRIGNSPLYNGGTTIFWQIDINGNIRTGKLIKYNSITGKRLKEINMKTNWVHYIHHQANYNLSQCLFGEHILVEETTMPVAIVESEKTAIIAQAKMPEYLWLATGGINEFKAKKLNVLKGRKVIAFPDLGAYDFWIKKASELEFEINVSDYLEKNASDTEREQGLDIADFL